MDLIVSQHLYVGNVTRTPVNHKQDINVRDEGVTLTITVQSGNQAPNLK